MNNIEKITDIAKSINDSLDANNYFAAISGSLILIDICASIEFEKEKSGARYLKWTEKYLIDLFKDESHSSGVLNKENIYYLRCSLLHQGSTDPTTQRAYFRNEFDKVYDIIPMINNVSNDKVIKTDVENPPTKEHLEKDDKYTQLPTAFVDVRYLCNKVIDSVSLWLTSKKDNSQFLEKDLNIFSVAAVGRRTDDENKLLIVQRP